MPTIRKTTAQVIDSETKALEDGVVEVIVATNSRDRHGEILDIKGLDTKKYSGVVLWGHDYFSFPIGKSLSLRKTKDGQLISRAQLAVEEYDFAKTAYELIKGGYITDVSIGFIPKEYDPELDQWIKSEMVEYSFVSIGANPDAKVTKKALEAIGLTKEAFEDQVRDHMLKMKEITVDESNPDPETPPEDPAPENKVDKDESLSDNVRKYIEVAKSAIADAEKELDALPGTAGDKPQKTKTIKKRIILTRAKKSLKTVDRVSELAIGELKKALREEPKSE